MRDRASQFDVGHALAPYLGQGDLSTTLLTDHTTVFHALVLAAITLIILYRSENLGTEQTISFRLERPVVNGLWFFHFSVGPVPDLAWRSERNSYRIETYWFLGFSKKAKQFFHISTYLLREKAISR
jgi:hypothetical protein